MVSVVWNLSRGVPVIAIILALGSHSAGQNTNSPTLPAVGSAPAAWPRPAAPSPVSPSPEGLPTSQSPGHPDSPPAQQVPNHSDSPPTQQPPTHPAAQSTSKPSLERELLKNILRDQKAIWTWPLSIRGEQARWLVPLGVGTAALIATDRYTAEDAGEFNNNNSTHQSISKDISYIGYVYGIAGVAGSFYLAGRIGDDPRARETGLLVAEAAANGTIVAQVLKYIAERPRPGNGSGHGAFFEGGSSFPSGHATVAWSMAAVVAREYKGHRWVAITAYGIAALVAAARFGAHEHFLSDVLVGSAIGYGIGRHVYNAHHDPELDAETSESKSSGRSFSTSRIALAPCYNPARREYGLSASLKF